jgi:predicted deacetylase
VSFAGVSQVFRTGNFRIFADNINCYQLVNQKVFRVRNILGPDLGEKERAQRPIFLSLVTRRLGENGVNNGQA